MGYHQLPSIRSYWQCDPDLHVAFVATAMPRDRFLQILRFLHCSDNTKRLKDCQDKLYKLREVIELLNMQFSKANHGTREQSIDESMILFKGRSSLKQYNPQKPIKRGYKIWCRASSTGFIHQFEVYQGSKVDADQTFARFGLGGRVVCEMTASLKGKGYIVMFDNFFTSLPLLEYLYTETIHACGTIRGNRKGLPVLKEDKMLLRGQFDFKASSKNTRVFKWKDNRTVMMASNYHGNEGGEVSRKQKDGKTMLIKCPLIIKDYNRFMGGVDKADMLRAIYGHERKSMKWWHRLFFGFVDMAVCNAYVSYRENHSMALLDFKRHVVQALVLSVSAKPSRNGRSPRSPRTVSNTKRRKTMESVSADIRLKNHGIHWPRLREKRQRCEMCSLKGIERKPFTYCQACSVTLCISKETNCFLEYHEIE